LVGVEPGCDSALLVHDSLVSPLRTESNRLAVPLPDFRDDPINLLWAIPITETEQQRLQDSTLTVDEILQRVRE
jgi:hypothetical protein